MNDNEVEKISPSIVLLSEIANKLSRFNECSDDGNDVNIGRDWLDCLTFLGLLERVQRSPAFWEMTEAGLDIIHENTATLESMVSGKS